MFSWGKPKRSPLGLPYPLVFKDAPAAIEYASAYMVCKIRPGHDLPAVVLDPAELFGASQSVLQRTDGIQVALIHVCGDGGGFETIAETSASYGPRLKPGDMVSWRPFSLSKEIAVEMGDERKGWVGLIIGQLSPELNADGWKGLALFRASPK